MDKHQANKWRNYRSYRAAQIREALVRFSFYKKRKYNIRVIRGGKQDER
jgi:hypothetical protein